MNKGIFETVLMTNKDYIEAVNRGESAEVQTNLLKQCDIIFKTMILNAGLAEEYKEYCERKIATEGKLF